MREFDYINILLPILAITLVFCVIASVLAAEDKINKLLIEEFGTDEFIVEDPLVNPIKVFKEGSTYIVDLNRDFVIVNSIDSIVKLD